MIHIRNYDKIFLIQLLYILYNTTGNIIMLLSEAANDVTIRALTPETHSFLHVPRSHGRGGGLAVLYRRGLNIIQQSTHNYHSFEYMFVILKNDSNLFCIILCYRPPPSNYNNMTHHSFLSEFSDMIDNQLYSGHTVQIIT